MPPPRHLHLSFSGIWGLATQPTEEWVMGLNQIYSPTAALTPTDLATYAGGLPALWQTRWAALLGSAARLTMVKASVVGADGKVERAASGAYSQAVVTADISSTGTEEQPLQITLAISLESSFSGPNGRGRFYLPTPVLGTLTRGVITQARADIFRGAAKGFVDDLNARAQSTAPNDIGRVCIASGGSVTKGFPPALYPVARVGCGRVVDTQRRRRSELNDAKVWQAVAA